MNRNTLGVILAVGGLIIAFIGYNLSQTAAAHINLLGQLFVTPEYKAALSQQGTGNTMLAVGVIILVIGLVMAVLGRSPSKGRDNS